MPGSLSQIWVLLVFIIPGFVLMRVKRVAYPTAEASTGSTMLDSLTLSCVVYALASPLLYLSYLYRWSVTRPVLFSILALVILLVLPCGLGTLYVRFTKSGRARWLREVLGFPNPDPTAPAGFPNPARSAMGFGNPSGVCGGDSEIATERVPSWAANEL